MTNCDPSHFHSSITFERICDLHAKYGDPYICTSCGEFAGDYETNEHSTDIGPNHPCTHCGADKLEPSNQLIGFYI